MAVVGSYTFMADAIVPDPREGGHRLVRHLLRRHADGADEQGVVPGRQQPLYATGFAKRAVDDGCQKINAVIIDGAQPYIPLMAGRDERCRHEVRQGPDHPAGDEPGLQPAGRRGAERTAPTAC